MKKMDKWTNGKSGDYRAERNKYRDIELWCKDEIICTWYRQWGDFSTEIGAAAMDRAKKEARRHFQAEQIK